MYSELKKNCETLIDELMNVRKDCLVDDTPVIKDYRYERLLHDIDRATNALDHVVRTITTFFGE